MLDRDILLQKEEYIYRFDARGQRFYVCAYSLRDAVEMIKRFDPLHFLQLPEFYRSPRHVSMRSLRLVGPRIRFRIEAYFLKGDAPSHVCDGWVVSPMPKGEMYRRCHSLLPAYYG